MAAGDARAVPIRGQVYRLQFALFKNDGTVISAGAGLDSEISKDGGTFTDCTAEVAEIATNSGHYFIDLTTTETNCTSAVYQLKSSSTGAVVYSTTIHFVTDAREVGFSPPVMFSNVDLDSTTARVPFYVFDLWGRPATGLTFSAAEIQISENGGAAANSGGTDAEVDATDFPGLYYYTPSAAETDTEGPYYLQIAKTGYISGGAAYEVATAVGVTNGAYDAHVVSLASNINGLISNLRKNTAWAGFMFDMFDATDMKTPEPGVTVTCRRSIDGAASALCTNAATEVDAVNLPGVYAINLSAADLNGNNIKLYFTAPGCTPFRATIITNPT